MAVIKIDYFFQFDQPDWTRSAVLLLVWNACEINSIIIAACIPTLVPLFRALFGLRPAGRHSTYPSWDRTHQTAVPAPAYFRLGDPRDTWVRMRDLESERNVPVDTEHRGAPDIESKLMGASAAGPVLGKESKKGSTACTDTNHGSAIRNGFNNGEVEV